MEYVTALDGRLLMRSRRASVDVEYRSGSSTEIQILDEFERLDHAFTVSGGAVIPVGDYAYRSAVLSLRTSLGCSLWGGVPASHGGLYNGDRTSVSLSGQWRVDYHLTFDASAEHNALTDETVTNVRLDYLHAPLSDLFLVFTEHRDRDPATPTDRLVSLKATKAVAF